MILMLVVSGLLYSQQYECNCEIQSGSYKKFLQDQLISVQYYNPIQYFRGVQYFNTWTSGNIKLINGEIIRDMTLRYDQYMDELLWLRHSDSAIGILNKSIVAGFDLFDTNGRLLGSFEKIRINLAGMGAIDAYLQVLAKGHVSLYAFRNVVKVIRESRTTNNTLYFIGVNSVPWAVSLRRRSLLNTPGINREAMKGIIRSNRLILRNNEANLARAVSIYNEVNK
ncbi:MAG: hypothetical protein JXB19_03370 [Bacteroidales bacterium]|nr:hypothetical protein [Bacteroidales bacterium]